MSTDPSSRPGRPRPATPAPGLSTRLQPENWSVPVKLAAVLMVPILLALVLGGMRIADSIHTATGLASLSRYVDLQAKVSDLAWKLQRERTESVLLLAKYPDSDNSNVQSAFSEVDTAQSDLQTSVTNPDDLGPSPASSYQRVTTSLGGLARLRTQATTATIDSNTTNPNAATGVDNLVTGVTTGYTAIINSLVTFEIALDRELNDASMIPLATGLSGLSALQEQIALQHTIIAAGIAKRGIRPVDADTVRTADARIAAATDQFRTGLDADQQRQFGSFIGSQATARFQALKQNALAHAGAKNAVEVNAQDWDNAYNALNTQLQNSARGITDAINSESAARQASSRNEAGVDSVILLLAMLAAAAVVYLVGRSLLRPLRVLRGTALEVAERRLPRALRTMREGKIPDTTIKPVPVTSLEEIGQVARAFDEVHGQAVRLAADQATLQANVSNMFVNLSRRSQTLVERQLQLIERLERNEQDSEQLANLFQLDHLATRMRRNSENLLVLAGSDLTKRGGAQVPLVDVLRAAVSEIEQYQRVVLQPPPSLDVVGRAANDLVHLVAELLDNATSFSAPETQVVVSATHTHDGSLLVEIADQGVGMAAEELAAFNSRLSGQSEMDVSASRRMGLFVVGRLATRHGIGVRLASSDTSRGGSDGVTVSVSVPAVLITARSGIKKAGGPERSGLVSRAGIEGTAVATRALANGSAARLGSAANGIPANGVPANGVPANGGPAQGLAANLPRRAVGAALDQDSAGQDGSRRPGGSRGPGGPGDGRPPSDGRRPAESGAPAADLNGGPQSNGRPDAQRGTETNGRPAAVNGHDGRGRPNSGTGRPVGVNGTPADGGGHSDANGHPNGAVRPEPSSHPDATRRSESNAPRGGGGTTEAGQPSNGSGRGNTDPADAHRNGRRRPAPVSAAETAPLGALHGPEAESSAALWEANTPAEPEQRADQPVRSEPARQPEQPRQPQQRPERGARPEQRPEPGAQPEHVVQPERAEPRRADTDPRQLPDPRQARGNGVGSARNPESEGESPIFEETSAWFRDNWQLPGPEAGERQDRGRPQPRQRPGQSEQVQPGGPARPKRPAQPGPAQRPEPPAERQRPAAPPVRPGRPADAPGLPAAAESERPGPRGPEPRMPEPGPRVPEPGPRTVRPQPAGTESSQPIPSREEPAGSEQPEPVGASASWSESPALLAPMPATEATELTAAGLPKRRPRAQLIPGSPGGSGDSGGPANPPRSAEQVRGRLASYQSGVRQGRENRLRRMAEAANSALSESNGKESS